MFPDQEPGGRGPPLENHPQNWSIWGWFFRGGPLLPGSWFGNHPTKKPPRGGGFFRSTHESTSVMWFMTWQISNDSCMHVTWLLRACAMTRTCVWQWHRLIDMCDMTHSYLRHVSFICVAWLVYMCVMTQSSVCHDSFMHIIWTHVYVWMDPIIRATWLIHLRGMTLP